MRLYELKAEYDMLVNEASEYAAENEGVIPDWLDEKIEGLGESIEAKAVSCGHIYKNANAEAEAIGAEIKKLQARKKAAENLAESMKKYLAMCIIPGTEIQTPTVVIGWRKSASVVIPDETKVPDEFCKIERTPKKKDIKAAIESGEILEWAMIEKKTNLQIR